MGFRFPDRCLGTLCKWSDSSRVGQVTRGRLVVGEPECACAARSRPENSHPRLGEKPCPGGLPMFSQAERGTPLRREEQGDLCCGRDGAEGSAGLPPGTPGARTQGPGVPAPWGYRAAYRRNQVSCGGQGTAWTLTGRERTPDPQTAPWKNHAQAPGPQVYPAHTVSEELGELLGSVAHGKSLSLIHISEPTRLSL